MTAPLATGRYVVLERPLAGTELLAAVTDPAILGGLELPTTKRCPEFLVGRRVPLVLCHEHLVMAADDVL